MVISKKSSTFAADFNSICALRYVSRSRAVVARQAHNLKVGGSIPPSATKDETHKKAALLSSFFFTYLLFATYLPPVSIGTSSEPHRNLIGTSPSNQRTSTVSSAALHKIKDAPFFKKLYIFYPKLLHTYIFFTTFAVIFLGRK